MLNENLSLVLSVHWRDFGKFSFVFISLKKGLSCQIMRSRLLSSFTQETWNAGWTLDSPHSQPQKAPQNKEGDSGSPPGWGNLSRKARPSGRGDRRAYCWEHWDNSRRVGKAHPCPEKHHRNLSKPSLPPKMVPPDRMMLASEDLVSQEKDFKSSSGFDRQPRNRFLF